MAYAYTFKSAWFSSEIQIEPCVLVFWLLNVVTLILRGLVCWTELVVEALQTGGCPRKTRQGWQGATGRMVDMAPQTGFRLLQSPRGRRKAYPKPVVKPAEKPKPEDPQVSGEPGLEVTGSPRASQGREQGWQEGWHVLGCQPHAVPSPRHLLCQSRFLQSKSWTCNRNPP